MIFQLEYTLLCFQNEQKVAFFGLQNATVEVLPDGSVGFLYNFFRAYFNEFSQDYTLL